MAVDCANCASFVCGTGRADVVPASCPMRGDFPHSRDLYSTDERRQLAYEAALVEAKGYCRWPRIKEIAEFARRIGYRRLGVAHCPDMSREAALTARYLVSHGLEGVLPPDKDDCDPGGQARFFSKEDTDFNVITGMCLGHDSLFIRASQVPVTSLVVRDTRLRHNPVAALYNSQSYYRDALYNRHKEYAHVPFQGWDAATLDRLAREVAREGRGEWCRVEEAMEFAHRLGATRLGVVFCVGFRHEARILDRVLRANGFEVASSCCKTGSVPKEEFGILDSQKVRPGGPEMICNPLAQAELLNREGVQLVLLLGQCVGHDTATMAHLEAPVVCIAAKDRVLAHNTAASLYALDE